MENVAPRWKWFPLPALVVVAATVSCMACAMFAGAPESSAKVDTSGLVEANPDIESRDLYYGVGGRANAPRTDVAYKFLERHDRGASPNLIVEDPAGRKWNAKIGTETRTEVAASRLLWAIGFHQPPVYHVKEWRIAGGKEAGVQPSARFRLEQPSWDGRGAWEWKDNPFVGTRELRGLIVMMAILNNWDVKDSNNKLYEARTGERGERRLYVAKDVGETFGRTVRVFLGTHDNLEDFQKEGFIRGVDDGRVDLYFRPVILNWGIERDIRVEDVTWTCRRLARLNDKQWRDAFRSAGYSDAETNAYVAKMKEKVREGLALEVARH